MKLRLSKTKIRVRLSPADLDALALRRTLSESIGFGEQLAWRYDVRMADVASSRIRAERSGIESIVMIELPSKEFEAWLMGNEIEWQFRQERPELEVSIEKDLKPSRG